MTIQKQGFSLMDMMIALLVVAVVAAASAPMVGVGKLTRLSGVSPWIIQTETIVGAEGESNTIENAVFGTKNNKSQKVFIGRTSAPARKQNAKLYIESGVNDDTVNPQIALGFGQEDEIPFKLWVTNNDGISFARRNTPFGDIANFISIGTTAVGEESVAIGQNSIVTANSVALGSGANVGVNASNAVALGSGASATGDGAIAIGGRPQGNNAIVTSAAGNAIAIGSSATALSSTVSIGNNAQSQLANERTVLIGAFSNGETDSIVIGGGNNQSRTTAGDQAVAIGTTRAAASSVVIGNTSVEFNPEVAVTIGNNALAGNNSIAIGNTVQAEFGGVAIGAIYTDKNSNVFVTDAGRSAVAIGQGTRAGENAIAIGSRTITGKNSVALGASIDNSIDANTQSESTVTAGMLSSAKANGAIALGTTTGAEGEGSIALGYYANAQSVNSIAIGPGAIAKGEESIAIGGMKKDGTYTRVQTSNDKEIALGLADNIVKIPSMDATIGNAVTCSTSEIVLGAASSTDSVPAATRVTIPGKLEATKGLDLTSLNAIQLGNGNSTITIPGNLIVKGNVQLATGENLPGDAVAGNVAPSVYLRAYDISANQSYMGRVVEYNGYNIGVQPEVKGPSTSDRRLKNVGEVFTGGLAELKKLELFHYTYKKDPDKTPQVGIMAQDLQKVFPTAVFEGKDGFLRIRWDEMFFALINAVKELDDKIEKAFSRYSEIAKLEKEVDALKKKNTELKERVEYMKEHVVAMKQDLEELE